MDLQEQHPFPNQQKSPDKKQRAGNEDFVRTQDFSPIKTPLTANGTVNDL